MKGENKKLISTIHKATGIIALLIITSFFISSLYGEIIGDNDAIITIKTYIILTIPVMLIVMPTCAITGKRLAKKSKSLVIKSKNKRIKIIAINAVILVILAFLLYNKAINGKINNQFLIIQIAELLFGLTNILLLGLMIRDGRLLTRRSIMK